MTNIPKPVSQQQKSNKPANHQAEQKYCKTSKPAARNMKACPS